jgi:DNA repair photolyase
MPAIYRPKGAAAEYSPLALNLYRGCVHGCLYCYAPEAVRLSPAEFHARTQLRSGILEQLSREAPKYRASDEPVLLCFTSDPYPPEGSEPTRRALEILRRHDVPVQVLTKGGTRACRDFDLLRTMRAAFGTTLLFVNDEGRQQWEPNAASVEDRLAAIGEAHTLGIRTWVSIEPIIDPEQALELIERVGGVVDELRIGRLNHHPLGETIDWRRWAPRLLRAALESGCDFLIKDALAKYLPREWPRRRGGWQVPAPVSSLALG